jgi:hypothetical protein
MDKVIEFLSTNPAIGISNIWCLVNSIITILVFIPLVFGLIIHFLIEAEDTIDIIGISVNGILLGVPSGIGTLYVIPYASIVVLSIMLFVLFILYLKDTKRYNKWVMDTMNRYKKRKKIKPLTKVEQYKESLLCRK